MLLSDRGARAADLRTKAATAQPQNAKMPCSSEIWLKFTFGGGETDLVKAHLHDLVKLGDKFAGQKEVEELLKGLSSCCVVCRFYLHFAVWLPMFE